MVSEEWVKLAGSAKGAVEHIIRMDSGCGFAPVPKEVKILMNASRKVLRVKYMHPTAKWVFELGGRPCKSAKTGRGGKARNVEKDCNLNRETN